MVTNYNTCNYYYDKGVNFAYISNEITLEEMIEIKKNNGENVPNMAMMPSAYYVMDKIYDDHGSLKEVTFYGGGYGHGVGMSQNGVKKMIELGYGYQEILAHYFCHSEIIRIKQDASIG